MELAEALTYARRQPLRDRVDSDRNEQRVALHATNKRCHLVGEIESIEHFHQLELGIGVANPPAVLNDAAFE